MLRSVLILIGLFLSLHAEARLLHGSSVSPASFTPQWSVLKVGAGGQITAVYNYADGTTLARADAFGAWVYEPTNSCSYGATVYTAPCWRNVATAATLPNYTIDTNFGEGAVELVAAPSNTNVLYMLWGFNGSAPRTALYVSTNRGFNWTLIPTSTGFPNSATQANDSNSAGPFIAVDPNNPDVVLVDTGDSGVYRSINGTSGASSTFTKIATVGATTIHTIAFQPGSSTHVGIAEVGTNGFYESTNGTSFTHVTTGSPPPSTLTKPHITCDKFNQFWVWASDNGTTHNWRWASSSWTQISPGLTPAGSGGGATSFAVDPNSAAVGSNHLAVADFTGQMVISSDNGATWSAQQTNESVSVGASQPTWIGTANQNQGSGAYLLNGYSIVFDQSSNLLFAGGLGMWKTNAPITGSATVWNLNTLGVEELIDVTIVSPPGGYPMMGVWDKGIFTLSNPDVFPSTYWNNSTSSPSGNSPIINGFDIDYVAAIPSTIVGCIPTNTGNSAISTDGGITWPTTFTLPGAQAGQDGCTMAVSTASNFIVVPSGSSSEKIYFTSNAGVSFTASTITGSPVGWNGKGIGFPLAADRLNTGNFCITHGANSFYGSVNGGANFTANSVTTDGNQGAFMLRSVPGQSSVYLYSSGEQSGAAGSHPANTHLWRMTKSSVPCDTATDVNVNLKEIISFGFGAMPPGNSSYTTAIYANGWFNGVQGIWKSLDGGTTWASINVPGSQLPWPLNTADFPLITEGDPDVYGRLYTGFQGSGGSYIDTADACPWVKFNPSSVKATSSLTGTVSLQAQHSGLVPVTTVNFYVDGTLIGSQTSGTGSPTTYTQSWVTGGVATGAHTLKVEAVGNGCTAGGGGNAQSRPITTH